MSYPCPVSRCDGRASEWGVCRSCAAAHPRLAARMRPFCGEGGCGMGYHRRVEDVPVAFGGLL